jgi:hypothetical protein
MNMREHHRHPLDPHSLVNKVDEAIAVGVKRAGARGKVHDFGIDGRPQ